MTTLRDDIERSINANSAENGSNTPDFILALYLMDCLAAFDRAVQARAGWYGRMDLPGQSAPPAPSPDPGARLCGVQNAGNPPATCDLAAGHAGDHRWWGPPPNWKSPTPAPSPAAVEAPGCAQTRWMESVTMACSLPAGHPGPHRFDAWPPSPPKETP